MKRRIAIIDDSRAKRAALAYVLRDSFDISAYGSGREALPDLLRCPPDLILLDIEMPDEDGFCVIRNIKAQPTLRDIPVIFITSVDDRHVEAEGLRLGAVDFISRNFVPETILARVNVHLVLKTPFGKRPVWWKSCRTASSSLCPTWWNAATSPPRVMPGAPYPMWKFCAGNWRRAGCTPIC